MGRTRTKTKKSIPVVSSASDSPKNSAPSISALLEKTQELIIQCDYKLARMFAKRVLDREPAHPEAREMLGVVLLETGDIDEARSVCSFFVTSVASYYDHFIWLSSQIFLSLIPPSSSAPSPPPPSAYLYLAQLTDDDPQAALSHYQHAIDILSVQRPS